MFRFSPSAGMRFVLLPATCRSVLFLSHQNGQVVAGHANFSQNFVALAHLLNVGFFYTLALAVKNVHLGLAAIAPAELSGTVGQDSLFCDNYAGPQFNGCDWEYMAAPVAIAGKGDGDELLRTSGPDGTQSQRLF